MGSQFLENGLPAEEKSYTQVFQECFPFYLSIGMSSAEYWEGDCTLTQYFRRAFKLRQEYDDSIAWLNGLYFYDALSTAIYNGFGRREGQKAKEYSTMPYSAKVKQKDMIPHEDKVKESKAQAQVWMKQLVDRFKK